VSIDFKEIRELLNAISDANIEEFSLKSDQFELTVRKGQAETVTEKPASFPPEPSSSEENAGLSPRSSPEADSPMQRSPDQSQWEDITSPIVGTFYAASAPGEPPFVKVGDQIQAHQTVCIVEAMKIMNEIEAEVSGKVMEINVQNGEPVEYGQTLMRIQPD